MKIAGEEEAPRSLYSDILVDKLIKRKEYEARYRSRRRVYLAASSAVALSVSASSVFIGILALAPNSSDILLPMVGSLAGLLVSIVIFFFLQRERERHELKREIYHLDDGKMRLIREWIAFERLSREFVEADMKPNTSRSLTEIIELISERGLIGEIDKGILTSALKSRNAIVHNGSSGLSASEEELLQSRLSVINEVLFDMFRKTTGKSQL